MLLLGTSSYSDELQENVKVTHSVFRRLREPFTYLFVMCTLMIMMALNSCCSDRRSIINYGPSSCPSLCTTAFAPRSQFPRIAPSQWLSMMQYKWCAAILVQHETPSTGSLAHELPIGLAETFLELHCSMRLLLLNLTSLSASEWSDLCFPPRTLSAYSYSLPLYPSQLLPSLAHLTHLGICFLEDPNSQWPWFLYYLTKQNQGNPWCMNEFQIMSDPGKKNIRKFNSFLVRVTN